ncbi:putative epidermal growth factor-like protein 8-like [Apostichopus japonicus]|uniref:Putative epidermal growth factor-like protein 8-like n=1 Tax=Stichopus japonicus TaxID=307972 RepID=A0A2G8LP69_STIJA|nr:putative epidermal growth factor-like protein 8-like [Apostichopus japonicus]
MAPELLRVNDAGVGEHVCRNSAYQDHVTSGITIETYCKPVFKPYTIRCGYNTRCTRYRTVYHLGYRKRYVTYTSQQTSQPAVDRNGETRYKCCMGWKQANGRSNHCSIPTCTPECQNGGLCVSPDHCACRRGWSGRLCADDVNECEHDYHGCSQICKNTNGTYQCGCYEGFALTADTRTCQVCISCSSEFQSLAARVELVERELGEMKKNQTLYNSFQIPAAVLPVVPVTSTTAASVPLPSNHLVLNDQHISQIERIQSLSEQISMLEERLEGCTCRNQRNQRTQYRRQPNNGFR